MTKLTNEIIAAATAAMKTISSLPLPLPLSNNMQNLTHKNDNTYDDTEETKYNNN